MDFPELWHCISNVQCVVPRLMGGLASAAILYLVASGLSLVFGVMGVLNFAHGALYMVGAYLGYTVSAALGHGGDLSRFVLALIIAPLLAGLSGIVIERVFLRRIYDRPILFQLLLTYAFVLILDDLVKLIWGSGYLRLPLPDLVGGSVPIVGRSFPVYQLLLIGMAVVVGLTLSLSIERTRFGRILRASAFDAEMVGAIGINVTRVWTLVFGLGAMLGGLAGVLAAPIRSIFPGMGLDVIVESFLVIVIGGLGSLIGAAVGAVIVSLFRTFGVVVMPGLELVFVYLVAIVVLMTRPRGLFGREGMLE